MSDDFNIFTDEDKQHAAYGMCVAGAALTGVAFGRFAGVQGILVLGAAGAAYGLLTCKHIAEPIKRNLFSQNGKLSESEFRQVLAGAKEQFPFATKAQLLDLVATARREAIQSPAKYRS